MQNALPLVSVIMPAYNQATYLPDAIESVLLQTYSHLELIIVDDGSTDHTSDICCAYAKKDRRVSFIKQQNQGPAAARNAALKLSKGMYVCFLDADDLMSPKKIETQLKTMLQDPSIDVTYTALQIIDDAGNALGDIRGQDYSPDELVLQMFFRNVIPGPNTYMAKKSCLDETPYNEHLRHSEDYELMIRLVQKYRFKYIDEPLLKYRRHGNNLSGNLSASRETELQVLKNYPKEHIVTLIEKSDLSQDNKQLMKGKIFYNMEEWDSALHILQQVSNPLSLFYQGNIHLKRNEYSEAKKCFEAALEQDPHNPALYNNAGAVYLILGHKANADKAFRKALELKPGYLDPQVNLKTGKVPPQITWRELRATLMPYKQER